MNLLIERIDGQISFQESIGNLTGINLLLDCKAEIERLLLANETLKELSVEYLERVKALEAKPSIDALISEIDAMMIPDNFTYQTLINKSRIEAILNKYRSKK